MTGESLKRFSKESVPVRLLRPTDESGWSKGNSVITALVWVEGMFCVIVMGTVVIDTGIDKFSLSFEITT